jgi:hypothetical protein
MKIMEASIMNYLTKLSGVTFGDCQQNIKLFGCPDVRYYSLIREPDNPHDRNAIRVAMGSCKLGYVPKDIAKHLAPKMDAGVEFEAEYVNKNTCSYNDTVGLTIKIYPA